MGRFEIEASGLGSGEKSLDAPTTSVIPQGRLRSRVGNQDEEITIIQTSRDDMKLAPRDPTLLGENLDLAGGEALGLVVSWPTALARLGTDELVVADTDAEEDTREQQVRQLLFTNKLTVCRQAINLNVAE